MSRWRDVKKGKTEDKKQEIHTQETDSLVLKNGSLILRFKAFLTDTFMLTMPLMYIVTYVVMGSLQDFETNKIAGWTYILLPHLLVVFLLWHFKRQTPGMKAYDLVVVDSNTGQKPTAIALLNRYIFTTLSMAFFFTMFIPYFNKSRRTLQDFVSGTIIQEIPNHLKTNK